MSIPTRPLFFVMAALCLAVHPATAQPPTPANGLFARKNLVAWCIVPFDARKRGPQERAEMLVRLGITKLAYDWRDEHVPSFEDEILAMKEHGIEFFAFWGQHEAMFRLFEKYDLAPQVWITLRDPGVAEAEKVETAAKRLLPLVERTRKLGCPLGLYNHGGWGGEPENLVAVAEWLRKNSAADHVGIVYNFHHAHDHIDDFPAVLARMKPYLLCLNLNGMNSSGNPKILPLGQGDRDRQMLKAVVESGYDGPIGIIGHTASEDVEIVLRRNLEGLRKLEGELAGKP